MIRSTLLIDIIIAVHIEQKQMLNLHLNLKLGLKLVQIQLKQIKLMKQCTIIVIPLTLCQ